MNEADQIKSLEAEVRRLVKVIDRHELDREGFVAHIARLQQERIREELGRAG